MKGLYINLDTCVDRRRQLEQALHAAGLDASTYARLAAVTASGDEPEFSRGLNSPGKLGLWKSMIRCGGACHRRRCHLLGVDPERDSTVLTPDAHQPSIPAGRSDLSRLFPRSAAVRGRECSHAGNGSRQRPLSQGQQDLVHRQAGRTAWCGDTDPQAQRHQGLSATSSRPSKRRW